MKKTIHTPHDRFFKKAMSNLQVAKSFFTNYLPIHIKQNINLDTLAIEKGSFVDVELKAAFTDMLFSVTCNQNQGSAFLYTLVEHQSTSELLMPLRLLKYMLLILEHYAKTHPQQPLPLIYPLVFYTGQTRYVHSTDFFDLFNPGHKQLAKESFLQPFQLIDLSQIPDEILRQEAWLGIMQLCMKHIFERDILPYLPTVVELFKKVEKAGDVDYIQATLTYLLNCGEVSNDQVFLATIQQNLTSAEGANIMTIAEQIAERGRQEGLQKGREEGKQEGKLEAKERIAKKLLQQGLSITAISQATELPINVVEALSTEDAKH